MITDRGVTTLFAKIKRIPGRLLEAYVLRVMADRKPNFLRAGVQKLLSGLESLYIKGVLSRKEKDLAGAKSAAIPVISVGNITTGGTGKTPCIIKLAGMLQKQGRRVAVISRGYGGQMEEKGGLISDGETLLVAPHQAGDEPYMIASRLPGVFVLVGKDRIKSAEKAKELGADVILLDDGFQYWKMKRDLDIVLIDATNPFGYGHVLPRGLLREPMEGLSRADVFVITKSDLRSADELEDIKKTLAIYNPAAPVLQATHKPLGALPFVDWRSFDQTKFVSTEPSFEKPCYVLVTALGNPASVEESVKKMGYIVRGRIDFPDHYKFRDEDLVDLWRTAQSKVEFFFEDPEPYLFSKRFYPDNGRLLITEKDAVKFIDLKRAYAPGMRIDVFLMEFSFVGDGEEKIKQIWEAIL